MKKYLSIALSTVLVFALLLSGCSSKSSQSSKEGTDGKTVIEFWHVNAENFGAPVIHDCIAEFNSSQDLYEVKERYNPNMYKGLMQNLQAEVASNNYPAIVMIGYNYLDYFAANFQYSEPQDIIDKYFPDDKDYLSQQFLPNILGLAQVNEKQIGLPYAMSTPILYYNADLFKKAGLDPENPPKTWNEVQEAANAIKKTTGDYGFYMQEYADNWAIQGLLTSNGAKILEKSSDKCKAVFASPESNEAYQILADMVKGGSALHVTADEGIGAFMNGKVGMLFGTSSKRASIEDASSFDLRGTITPGFEGKKISVPAGGNFLAITAQDEAKQKGAMEFLKFILQPKWMAKWSMGTGYIPTTNGVVDNPEGLKNFIEENKLMSVALDTMPNIVSWASFPDNVGVQAEQIFADTRDSILAGNVTVEQGLKAAQDQINKLLK